MFCMNCGMELPSNARFCNKCGTPTEQIADHPAVSPFVKIAGANEQPGGRLMAESGALRDVAIRVEEFFGVNRWNPAKDKSALRRLETDFQTYLADRLEGLLTQCSVIDQTQRHALLERTEIRKDLERTIVKNMLLCLFLNRKKVSEHAIWTISDRLGAEETIQLMNQVTTITNATRR